MKNMLKRWNLGLLALAALPLALASPAAEPPSYGGNDYTKAVNRPYAEVLEAVKAAAQAQGFRICGVHDIAASLLKDGIYRSPYATVELWNTRIAAQVLKAEPLLGPLMPCRIAVFQKGDQTVVSMIRPTRLMGLLPLKPEVAQDAVQLDQFMKAVIDMATH